MSTPYVTHRLDIRSVGGVGGETYHVYYSDRYCGSIHQNSTGWHMSGHEVNLGPFATPDETFHAVACHAVRNDIHPMDPEGKPERFKWPH